MPLDLSPPPNPAVLGSMSPVFAKIYAACTVRTNKNHIKLVDPGEPAPTKCMVDQQHLKLGVGIQGEPSDKLQTNRSIERESESHRRTRGEHERARKSAYARGGAAGGSGDGARGEEAPTGDGEGGGGWRRPRRRAAGGSSAGEGEAGRAWTPTPSAHARAQQLPRRIRSSARISNSSIVRPVLGWMDGWIRLPGSGWISLLPISKINKNENA